MSKYPTAPLIATIFGLAALVAGSTAWAQQPAVNQNTAISADAPGRKILHGARTEYPSRAREQNIEGTVALQLTLDASGEVVDARVLSGPEELRNAALTSAVQWHFASEPGQSLVVSGTFTFKINPSAAGVPKPQSTFRPATLKHIDMESLPPTLADALKSRLPVHEGDQLTSESLQSTIDAMRETDEHLSFYLNPDPSNDSTFLLFRLGGPQSAAVAPPAVQPFNPPVTDGVKRIRVGGNVQSSKLTFQEKPVYPPLAKQARIQGVVRFDVLIGNDGSIRSMQVANGHPLLIPAAQEAVRQWRYQPTLLNGEPAEVVTVVDVNFTLSQ